MYVALFEHVEYGNVGDEARLQQRYWFGVTAALAGFSPTATTAAAIRPPTPIRCTRLRRDNDILSVLTNSLTPPNGCVTTGPASVAPAHSLM